MARTVSRGRTFAGIHHRDAGIWVIRRQESGQEVSRSLEKERPTKLDLQTYVSGKLHELRTLPAGWDDADGAPLPQTVTHAAYRILDRISDHRTVFPFITPGEDGAILLEWRAGSERLELEFSPDELPYVLYVDPNGVTKMNGVLGSEGVGFESVRGILAALSLRVWTANPAWKRLFI
jgi:hypothetical protein